MTATAVLLTASILLSSRVSAEGQTTNDVLQNPDTGPRQSDKGDGGALNRLGFAPALFMGVYNDDVIDDTGDVRLRGDGTLEINSQRLFISLGIEAHYSFHFYQARVGYGPSVEAAEWTHTVAWAISPFIGLFDVDKLPTASGVFGVMVSHWRGDVKYENRDAWNFGLGLTIHPKRLVLADGFMEGRKPAMELVTEDFTRERTLIGWTIVFSKNLSQ